MKSITYPYVYCRRNGVWIMRDGAGEKPRRHLRKSEVVAWGIDVDDVLSATKDEQLGRHFVSHLLSTSDDSSIVKENYKANGYRYLLSEGMFAHDEIDVSEYACDPPVIRVLSSEDADKIRRERRNKRAIREVDLLSHNPQHRLYAVIDGEKALGWVSSVPFGEISWIADLYVLDEFRGRGYGRALMSAVTMDDRRHGVNASVLLASAAGARLYPHIGYKKMGSLQLFCPKR
jgi:GNAT superfamily N-acetyltransferase